MKILGIETSCDETAASVIDYGRGHFVVRSNVVYSQVKTHAKTGGVVPEVAAREHCVKIVPVIDAALKKSGANEKNIDALAVTAGPGLVTALVVGVEAAKTLAWLWEKPLIPVNHIEAHAISPLLMNDGARFPALALVVSGGHTELLLLKDAVSFRCIGKTIDDAAGEAFDKVAKLLHLGYPGGPAISRAAEQGNAVRYKLPRPLLNAKGFDFSFAGLKTAVLYATMKQKCSVPDMAASFQQAAIDVLVAKTVAAAEKFHVRSVFLAGGVAANTQLRATLASAVKKIPATTFHVPAFHYCTDNAAMIAARGAFSFHKKRRWPWENVIANPNWETW